MDLIRPGPWVNRHWLQYSVSIRLSALRDRMAKGSGQLPMLNTVYFAFWWHHVVPTAARRDWERELNLAYVRVWISRQVMHFRDTNCDQWEKKGLIELQPFYTWNINVHNVQRYYILYVYTVCCTYNLLVMRKLYQRMMNFRVRDLWWGFGVVTETNWVRSRSWFTIKLNSSTLLLKRRYHTWWWMMIYRNGHHKLKCHCI